MKKPVKLNADKSIFMLNKFRLKNQQGFTLIEVICAMIIIGVIASVATQKFDVLSDTAAAQALRTGERELNVREYLSWSNQKISSTGWLNDDETFATVDTDLGPGYGWNSGPTAVGGTLIFRSKQNVLNRDYSTNTSAGNWH